MMILKTKALLVVGLMMAGGVAAPVVTHYATQPAERPLPAKADLAPEIEAPSVLKKPAVDRVILESLVVKPGPKPSPVEAALVAPVSEPEPEKKCERRQLQTVGSGAVVICDVQRSSSGKAAGGIFAPIDKPETLAPRDLPSPTGLIR